MMTSDLTSCFAIDSASYNLIAMQILCIFQVLYGMYVFLNKEDLLQARTRLSNPLALQSTAMRSCQHLEMALMPNIFQ